MEPRILVSSVFALLYKQDYGTIPKNQILKKLAEDMVFYGHISVKDVNKHLEIYKIFITEKCCHCKEDVFEEGAVYCSNICKQCKERTALCRLCRAGTFF
jgi:hypothetical protein